MLMARSEVRVAVLVPVALVRVAAQAQKGLVLISLVLETSGRVSFLSTYPNQMVGMG